MKTNKFTIISTTATMVILMLLLLTSCKVESINKSVWIVDSGFFHTNDVKRAQTEIPFTIVLPTYLPNGMRPNYPYQIDGPVKNPNYRQVEIEISYVKDDSSIYVDEKNAITVMMPTMELDAVYLDISGTRVLQQISRMSGSSNTVEGLVFDWNQQGLTFSVEIYGINGDEGLKIVDSMVKQLNQ